jgi:hypothetical protein
MYFNPVQIREIFLRPKVSRAHLGPKKATVNWAPGEIVPGA